MRHRDKNHERSAHGKPQSSNARSSIANRSTSTRHDQRATQAASIAKRSCSSCQSGAFGFRATKRSSHYYSDEKTVCVLPIPRKSIVTFGQESIRQQCPQWVESGLCRWCEVQATVLEATARRGVRGELQIRSRRPSTPSASAQCLQQKNVPLRSRPWPTMRVPQ